MVHIFDMLELRGERLAAACSDGTVRLLTLRRSGDSERVLGPFAAPVGCLARIRNPASSSSAAAAAEEEDRLCLCCTDGTVYIYRDGPHLSEACDEGRRLYSWRAHEANIFDCLAVGPDRLLTCSSDGTVKLWDLRETEARHVATFQKKNYPFHTMHLVLDDGGDLASATHANASVSANAAAGEEDEFVGGAEGASAGILVAAGGTTGMFGTPWFAQVVDFSVL